MFTLRSKEIKVAKVLINVCPLKQKLDNQQNVVKNVHKLNTVDGYWRKTEENIASPSHKSRGVIVSSMLSLISNYVDLI